MSLSSLLARAHPLIESRLDKIADTSFTLFFSLSDGKTRATVCRGFGPTLQRAWLDGVARCQREAQRKELTICWLRIDWVTDIQASTWGELSGRLARTKRNYFRVGLSLDAGLNYAFLEQELCANAMLYPGASKAEAGLNEKNFTVYAKRRFGQNVPLDFSTGQPVFLFSHDGLFLADDASVSALPGGEAHVWLPGAGKADIRWRDTAALNASRRQIETLDQRSVYALIDSSASFLARQVKPTGQFIYGHFPCFGREIPTYNSLRHASSVYSMLEGWELTKDETLLDAIRRALAYLTNTLIRRYPQPDGTVVSYNVDVNGEIKLGANAVSLLALVKYDELTGDTQHRPLMEELALGVARMQNTETGGFVHVLNADDLTLKEAFRIVYYDGEAAFGLMRLYGLTADPRWIAIVEKAFDYFIAVEHWKHHDHWLSYCANELTLHKPEEKYFRFGVQNIAGYLDFILQRETTYPTLLELSMAFDAMLRRIEHEFPHMGHVLDGLDIEKFYRALHHRAHYLLNGFFWPEQAMYFANPKAIVGSFFIRHHTFRVRIDDIEHYLSGYASYLKMMNNMSFSLFKKESIDNASSDAFPVIAWGGDVNLGRRQHYRTSELGYENVLIAPDLKNADLSIVNLECVVSTLGEQGVPKGEGGPYYYRARPEMLRVLVEAGIDVVTVANNHSGDYGLSALLEQQSWLEKAGILHVGSGVNRDAAFQPIVCKAGELNVAIFSIDATQVRFSADASTPGIAYLSLTDINAWVKTLKPRIDAIRRQAHVVFVAVHWGNNQATNPEAEVVKVGKVLIDIGADAVIGASAHILHGFEIYKNRPIIYDAGDLLFDAVRNSYKVSGVFRLSVSHRGVEKVEFVPVGVGFGFSKQLSGDDTKKAIEDYVKKCNSFGTNLTIYNDRASLILDPPLRDTRNINFFPVSKKSSYSNEIDFWWKDSFYKWSVNKIPDSARIEPVRFGPLSLLGVQVTPKDLVKRGMIWVESFWICDELIDENIRLNIQGVPSRESSMPYWGVGMDHDPCDWMMPTSRWKPGVIYRDYYGLRPPVLEKIKNISLDILINIISKKYSAKPLRLSKAVRLNLQGLSSEPRSFFLSEPLPYRTQFPSIAQDCLSGQTWSADQLEVVTNGRWLVRPPAGWYVRSVVAGPKHIDMFPGPVLFLGHDSRDRWRHEQMVPDTNSLDRNSLIPNLVSKLAGAIVSDTEIVPKLPVDFPVLEVSDPMRAFIELGLAARERFKGAVVAVTGTVGKSTTVSMIQTMLGGPDKVLASMDNYNSRVGVPALLASLPSTHKAAVLEVAQSALWMNRGPITTLVKPTVGVITEIGISQLNSGVKDVQDSAKWKSRIFHGLSGSSIAVIGRHLACFDFLKSEAEKHAERVIVFGSEKTSDVVINSMDFDGDGTSILLDFPHGQVELRVPFPGLGMAHNAVAALCVAYGLGEDLNEAMDRLSGMALSEGRWNKLILKFDDKVVRLIDDSFNAELLSMRNAFSIFRNIKTIGEGRKVVVLGRIAHLGEMAKSLHESLAEPLLDSGVDYLVTHGAEMLFLRDVMPSSVLGPHFSSAKPLAEFLKKNLNDNDLVLVKGAYQNSDFNQICKILMGMASSVYKGWGD